MKKLMAKDCLSKNITYVHDEERPNFYFDNFAVFNDLKKKNFLGLVGRSNIFNQNRIFADLIPDKQKQFVYMDTPAVICEKKMRLFNVDVLPVLDENENFQGIVTSSTIAPIHLAHNNFPTAKIITHSDDLMDTELFDALSLVLHGVELYHDSYTLNHEKNVCNMMKCLGGALGYNEKHCSDLEQAGGLHDIGKLALPPQMLDKPGKFSAFERQVVEMHPLMGSKILEKVAHPLAQLAAKISLYHHEAYDGTGYPYGLKKEEIPVEARICSVCDVYEAMRAHRPYHERIESHEVITQKILNKKNDGLFHKFDPKILDAFAEIHEEFDRIFCSALSHP